MARSQFSAWLDRNSDSLEAKTRGRRRFSERLLRLFDLQSLALLLFYAIVILTLVSFTTTALALFNLLVEGADADGAVAGSIGQAPGAALGESARFAIAVGTTFGVQTTAVVLSLLLGISAAGLLTRLSQNPNWMAARKLIVGFGTRLRQILGLGLVSFLLFPFLSFSILFSYATFHKHLETTAEIEQKSTNDLFDLFNTARTTIIAAIDSQRSETVEGFGPSIFAHSTTRRGEVRVVLGEEEYGLAAQLQRGLWPEFKTKIDRVQAKIEIDNRPEIRSLQAREKIIEGEVIRLRTLNEENTRRIDVLSQQTIWEHARMLTLTDANSTARAYVRDLPSGIGGCRASEFFNAVEDPRPIPLLGLLHIILERAYNENNYYYRPLPNTSGSRVLDSGPHNSANSEGLRDQVRRVRTRIVEFVYGTALDGPQDLSQFALTSEERAILYAAAREIENQSAVLVDQRIAPCSSGIGDFFRRIQRNADQLAQQITITNGKLTKLDVELQNDVIPALENFRDLQLQPDADRLRRVDEALSQAKNDINAFFASLDTSTSEDGETEEQRDALATKTTTLMLDDIFAFAAVIDNDIFLQRVQPRLLGSLESLSCRSISVSSVTTPQNLSKVPDDLEIGNCLQEAIQACSILSTSLQRIGTAAKVPTPTLYCGKYAVPPTNYRELIDLYIARESFSGVVLNPGDSTDLKTLREQQLPKLIRALSATAVPSMSASVNGVYLEQLSKLNEKLFEFDGTPSVRRSWNRLGPMFAELGFTSPSGDIGSSSLFLWDGLSAFVATFFGGAAEENTSALDLQMLNEEDGAPAETGLNFLYEAYAFAIAVTIDVMIVLLSVLVIMLRRTPLLAAQGHHAEGIDERHLEEGVRGIQREDPAIFSIIGQHCVRIEDPDYAAEIDLARIPGQTRRARASGILALLGNQVNGLENGRYQIGFQGHVYIRYMASQEDVSAEANPYKGPAIA